MKILPNVYSPVRYRYSLALKEIFSNAPKILDVGGYSSREKIVRDYFSVFEYTSLNVGTAWYKNETCDFFYNGIEIPFDTKAYEFVISVDTFEHISHENREKLLKEMIRVAGKRVVLVVPFVMENQKTDESFLIDVCQKYNVDSIPSLVEHELFGLPTLEELQSLAEKYSGSMRFATPRKEYWSIQMAMLWNSIALNGESQEVNRKLQKFQEEDLIRHMEPITKEEAYRCVMLFDK